MDSDLKGILSQSTFSVTEGGYVYAKVSEIPPAGVCFMVSRDDDEITAVVKEECLSELQVIERNKETWSLIALNVSIPFYSVGFLAAVSSAIAEKGINILMISTYSKDYVLVKKEAVDKATKTLLSLGMKRGE